MLYEISPSVVEAGAQVRIAGAHFAQDTTFQLDGASGPVTFQVLDESLAVATVPTGSGAVPFTARSSGGSSNPVSVSYGDGFVESNDGLGYGGDVWSIAVTSGPTPRIFAATAGGIYRSDDGGATWRNQSLGLHRTPVRRVVASPVDPERLYLCTLDGQFFRTHDHGEAWQRLGQPYPGGGCTGLAAHPTDPDQVFASSGGWVVHWTGQSWNSHQGGFGISVAGDLVYETDPGVMRWNYRTGERTELLAPPIGPGFVSVSASPLAAGLIYAVTSSGTDSNGNSVPNRLMVSSDSGATWFQNATEQPWYALADPTLPDRVYTWTGSRVRMSDDRGRTFSDRYYQDAAELVGVRDIGLVAGHPDQVWLATNGGPLRWDGSRWISGVQGMRAFTSLDLEVAPSAPSRVYLAAGRHGLFRSDDGGQTWVAAAATSCAGCTEDVQAVGVDPTNPDVILVGTATAIHRSIDGGDTWQATNVLPFLFPAFSLDFEQPRRLAFDGHTAIVPAWMGSYRSDDGGLTFTRLGNTAMNTWGGSVHLFGGTAYAATEGGLFSMSAGQTDWTSIFPNTEGSIDVIQEPGGHLFYSTSWRGYDCAGAVCDALPQLPSWTSFILAEGATAGSLFAGATDGLYRLDLPAGAAWVPMTYGTGHQQIDAVAVVDPSTPYGMLVGTAGNGVLRLKRNGP